MKSVCVWSPAWQCVFDISLSRCVSAVQFGCVCTFIFKCVWAHYYSPCAAPATCLITSQSPLYVRVTHHTHTSFLFIVCMASSFLRLPSSLPRSFLSFISPHFFITLLLSLFVSACRSLSPSLSCFLSVSPLSSSLSHQKHPLAVWKEIRMYTCNEKV